MQGLTLRQTGESGMYADEASGVSATYDSGSRMLQVFGLKETAPLAFTIENFTTGTFGISLQDNPEGAHDWEFAGTALDDSYAAEPGGILNGERWFWYIYGNSEDFEKRTFLVDAIPSLSILGNGGNDDLWGLNRADNISGGSGNDIIVGAWSWIDSNGQAQYIPGPYQGDLLDGGAGIDLVSGSGGADVVIGGDDNDFLEGMDENDNIRGDAGSDVLAGGSHDDILLGGIGDDILVGDGYFTHGWLSVNDLVQLGVDFTASAAGYYTGYVSRNFTIHNDAPNDGADILIGGAGRDWLDGGAGADTLDGGSESDSLFGGEGDDWLYAGDGDDWLVGDNGDLTGAGNDTLDGAAATICSMVLAATIPSWVATA